MLNLRFFQIKYLWPHPSQFLIPSSISITINCNKITIQTPININNSTKQFSSNILQSNDFHFASQWQDFYLISSQVQCLTTISFQASKASHAGIKISINYITKNLHILTFVACNLVIYYAAKKSFSWQYFVGYCFACASCEYVWS